MIFKRGVSRSMTRNLVAACVGTTRTQKLEAVYGVTSIRASGGPEYPAVPDVIKHISSTI